MVDEITNFINSKEAQITIYGVLKRIGIRPTNNNFEDYYQEAQIVFLLWLNEPLAKTLTKKRCLQIAYTRMYRKLINLRKHEFKIRDVSQVEVKDDLFLKQKTKEVDSLINLHGISLTKRQQDILNALIVDDNKTKVANQLKLSKRTVFREINILKALLIEQKYHK